MISIASMAPTEHDPWYALLAAPADETAQQRADRLAAEATAKQISDEIDDALRRERQELVRQKQRGTCVRVLLLGESAFA